MFNKTYRQKSKIGVRFDHDLRASTLIVHQGFDFQEMEEKK